MNTTSTKYCDCKYDTSASDSELPLHRPRNISTRTSSRYCYVTKPQFQQLYPTNGENNYASKNPLAGQFCMGCISDWQTDPDVAAFKKACRASFSRYPRRPNVPHVFLLGDSTGNQIYNPVSVALQGKYTISNIYASQTQQRQLFLATNGMTYVNAVFDVVSELMTSDEDMLIVSFRHANFAPAKNKMPVVTALEAARQRISTKNFKLILVGAPGDMPINGYEYLLPEHKDKLGAPEAELNAGQRGEYYDALRTFADQNANTYFFETEHLFCGEDEICGPRVPGTPTLAYWDTYHLTPPAAYYMWPFICEQFDDAGLL